MFMKKIGGEALPVENQELTADKPEREIARDPKHGSGRRQRSRRSSYSKNTPVDPTALEQLRAEAKAAAEPRREEAQIIDVTQPGKRTKKAGSRTITLEDVNVPPVKATEIEDADKPIHFRDLKFGDKVYSRSGSVREVLDVDYAKGGVWFKRTGKSGSERDEFQTFADLADRSDAVSKIETKDKIIKRPRKVKETVETISQPVPDRVKSEEEGNLDDILEKEPEVATEIAPEAASEETGPEDSLEDILEVPDNEITAVRDRKVRKTRKKIAGKDAAIQAAEEEIGSLQGQIASKRGELQNAKEFRFFRNFRIGRLDRNLVDLQNKLAAAQARKESLSGKRTGFAEKGRARLLELSTEARAKVAELLEQRDRILRRSEIIDEQIDQTEGTRAELQDLLAKKRQELSDLPWFRAADRKGFLRGEIKHLNDTLGRSSQLLVKLRVKASEQVAYLAKADEEVKKWQESLGQYEGSHIE